MNKPESYPREAFCFVQEQKAISQKKVWAMGKVRKVRGRGSYFDREYQRDVPH